MIKSFAESLSYLHGTCYTKYKEKYFSDNPFSYYSLCHYMRAWRRVELSVVIAKKLCHGYTSYSWTRHTQYMYLAISMAVVINPTKSSAYNK